MSSYQIIDEPKVRGREHLIVNPIIILFVAIFLPLIWMPPYFGRWWMPLVWLGINGYLLGSSTLKKEIVTSIVGVVLMVGLFFTFVFFKSAEPFKQFESYYRYMFIILNGLFFLILYLVVFRQSVAFEIYSYIKEGRA